MSHHGDVTPDLARQFLQTTAATREQASFFEAFIALVYEPVEARGFGSKEALLLVACDRSRMELQITAATDLMRRLADDFLQQIGVPDVSGVELFNIAARESSAEQASLLCRIKRIGSPSPVADVGFAIERQAGSMLGVSRLTAVPPTKDYEVLQKHASDNKCEPSIYGTSILPDNRGRAPTILEYNMAMVNSAKMIVAGLGFFRALSFGKPEDTTLRLLKECGAEKCMIRAFLTVDGLTQLSLRMHGSSTLILNEERADSVRQFYAFFGGDPCLVEYTMDSQGPSLAVGYTHATVEDHDW